MQDHVRPRLDERSFDRVDVSEIAAVQCNLRCREARDVRWDLPDKPMDLVTVASQSLRYVASNESRDARDENALHRLVS
jgi:hypothetical protein